MLSCYYNDGSHMLKLIKLYILNTIYYNYLFLSKALKNKSTSFQNYITLKNNTVKRTQYITSKAWQKFEKWEMEKQHPSQAYVPAHWSRCRNNKDRKKGVTLLLSYHVPKACFRTAFLVVPYYSGLNTNTIKSLRQYNKHKGTALL